MLEERPIIYCVVPAELAGELYDSLHQFFGDDPSVEVVVEQRSSERRRGRDRRELPQSPQERRKIRAKAGRRIEHRRAALVPAQTPELPPQAEPYRDRITFVERLEPPTLAREDADTARLVGRLQGGEHALFGHLYQRYFDRVYAYLRITLQDAHEAEDATQEVFLRVLEALPKYERRAAPFRAWLFRIVRNSAINRLRQRQRLSVESPDELARRSETHAEMPAPTSLQWLDDHELLGLVEQLPLAQRQVIVLRYMMELRSSEIAEVLDRSPDAIRQLHARAMRFLRGRMAPRRSSAMERGAAGPGRRRIRREPMSRLARRSPVLRQRRFSYT
jgi:RNA polymerase sigma-70 factor, ECF subfamily